MKLDTLSQENAEVVLKVRVTNLLEEYAGKEVVQVYAAPPIESVDRPRRTLVAFAKTKLLAPGEPQLLTIRIPADRLTNYNETESTFELEAGAYTLSLGGSLESAVPCAALQVKDSFVTETCADLFGDAHPEEPIPRPRVETPVPDASLPTLELDESKFFTTMHGYAPVEQRELLSGIPDLTFDALKEGRTTVEDFTACLTVEEMATLCVGSARFSMKDFSVIGNQSKSLPGAAGETTDLLFEKYGIPSAVMADGPAGLRITPVVYEKDGYYLKNPADDPTFRLILPPDAQAIDLSGATVSYHYCTALPTATTLAQTWNMELLETAGDIVGSEMEELGIHLWLAPGMNIQKNPLCGRNFEYYSEDPLLTGLCGAQGRAEAQGVRRDHQTHRREQPGDEPELQQFSRVGTCSPGNLSEGLRTLRPLRLPCSGDELLQPHQRDAGLQPGGPLHPCAPKRMGVHRPRHDGLGRHERQNRSIPGGM